MSDFYKFDGAGNDFVLIDNRDGQLQLSREQIAHICHRRFGVGADGLMTLEAAAADYDFVMKYYNSDGGTASMCGNGGRCIVAFAHLLGVEHRVAGASCYRFLADDGPHLAEILEWNTQTRQGMVRLGMRDVAVDSVRRCIDGWLLNTGVPHYVQQVSDLGHFDVVGEGRRLRHHPELGDEGANVNFIEQSPDGILHVRTYERGVEDETWACGTGVTACAIVSGCNRLQAPGGYFEVTYQKTPETYTNVRLQGPVSLNFTGELKC